MKFYRAMGIPGAAHRPRPRSTSTTRTSASTSVVEEIDEAFLTRVFGESAGYLFEYKWTFAYHFEYLGSDLTAYAASYEPKTHVNESLGALYLPVEAMMRTITDAPDDSFDAAVAEYLDLADVRAARRRRRPSSRECRRPDRELGPQQPLPLPVHRPDPAPVHRRGTPRARSTRWTTRFTPATTRAS